MATSRATVPRDGDPRSRPSLGGAADPLVRAVARVPASVLTKLLVAFAGTVALLVMLGVLGLGVISDSNARVVTLGGLQARATAYRQVQAGVAAIEQVLTLRLGHTEGGAFFPPLATIFSQSADGRRAADGLIQSLLNGQTGATDPSRLGFAPPAEDQGTLTQIARGYLQLSEMMTRIADIDTAGTDQSASSQIVQGEALPLATDLRGLADTLVADARAATDRLIDLNRSSLAASQVLFIAFALGSIVLALLLGFVLSWSIVGPIRKMEARLAAIASGDFSGHVAVPNRDELGSLATNLNVMNDELERLYRELEAASRHKSEFLASMSHELRTPLNAIIGFSQVLREQMFGELNDRQLEYLDDILDSSQHLLNLINDILDLSKVESGRMELALSTVALPGLLEGSMSMVRERALRSDVTLVTTVDPSVGLIEADERKVKQILFNLLSNAVKFTPAGGSVTLAARADGEAATIEVRDTGVGIGPEDQVRIFEEFYQVGSGRAQEGTGLGLALTRRLVELHHGRLSVASEPAAGSTFTVVLPLHQPSAEREVTAIDGEPAARGVAS